MYSKFVAILINSAFGLCITYTVFSVYFALTSKFIVERSFIIRIFIVQHCMDGARYCLQ